MSEDSSPTTAAAAVDTPTLDASLPAEQETIRALAREVDLADTQSIIHFGAGAQKPFIAVNVAALSDDMLEGVRNKDTGPAGEALNRLVSAVRGFDLGDIDPNAKPGFLARLFGGGTKPVAKFVQRYEVVREQIDAIADDLERHKTTLLTDITMLDRLYTATLDGFHQLERYIAAGEQRLADIDRDEVPALERAAAAGDSVLEAQKLRDLRGARDALERRVHDLRLTRQVVMQALPSIRLVQENDRGLVNKIVSTVANTLPLWRQQLAQAVTIQRSREAAGAIGSASDLTNELLDANAKNLRLGNAEARAEMERGVFDIETVERANQSLIETIRGRGYRLFAPADRDHPGQPAHRRRGAAATRRGAAAVADAGERAARGAGRRARPAVRHLRPPARVEDCGAVAPRTRVRQSEAASSWVCSQRCSVSLCSSAVLISGLVRAMATSASTRRAACGSSASPSRTRHSARLKWYQADGASPDSARSSMARSSSPAARRRSGSALSLSA